VTHHHWIAVGDAIGYDVVDRAEVGIADFTDVEYDADTASVVNRVLARARSAWRLRFVKTRVKRTVPTPRGAWPAYCDPAPPRSLT